MFITFEGIEGSGKSTQSRLIDQWFRQNNYKVLLSKEPGGCSLGAKIRQILLSQESQDLTSKAELFLYLADRAQHVSQVIKPALSQGSIVIVDRYIDSTIVYQGYGRGIDVNLLQILNELAISGLKPDLTFLLDLPVEVGLNRAKSRNMDQDKVQIEGRFEAEDVEFHKRIRKGYLEIADLDKNRIKVVDGTNTVEDISREVLGIVQSTFQTRH